MCAVFAQRITRLMSVQWEHRQSAAEHWHCHCHCHCYCLSIGGSLAVDLLIRRVEEPKSSLCRVWAHVEYWRRVCRTDSTPTAVAVLAIVVAILTALAFKALCTRRRYKAILWLKKCSNVCYILYEITFRIKFYMRRGIAIKGVVQWRRPTPTVALVSSESSKRWLQWVESYTRRLRS